MAINDWAVEAEARRLNGKRKTIGTTESGRDFATTLIALTQWSEKHVLKGPAPIKVVDRKTGSQVRAVLQGLEGHEVPIRSLVLAERE